MRLTSSRVLCPPCALVQTLTMKLMYRIIADAINEAGLESNPRDYLAFFSLVNREEGGEEAEGAQTHEGRSEQVMVENNPCEAWAVP